MKVDMVSNIDNLMNGNKMSNQMWSGMLNISAFTVSCPDPKETLGQIPSGLVSVSLTIDHFGIETKGNIAAGIAGIKIDTSKDVPVVESIHGWTILH